MKKNLANLPTGTLRPNDRPGLTASVGLITPRHSSGHQSSNLTMIKEVVRITKHDNTTQTRLVNVSSRRDNIGGSDSLLYTQIRASSTTTVLGYILGVESVWHLVLYYWLVPNYNTKDGWRTCMYQWASIAVLVEPGWASFGPFLSQKARACLIPSFKAWFLVRVTSREVVHLFELTNTLLFIIFQVEYKGQKRKKYFTLNNIMYEHLTAFLKQNKKFLAAK